MTYVFYMLVCIFLVTLRTTVLPMLSIRADVYDLLIPVIIYLGFFRAKREGIPVVLLFGWVMDGLSGVAFGFFLSCYVWLYVTVLLFKQFFLVRNMLLLSFVTVLGVLMQNGLALVTENLLALNPNYAAHVLQIASLQILQAAVTGPFVIWALMRGHRFWGDRIGRLVAKENGNSG